MNAATRMNNVDQQSEKRGTEEVGDGARVDALDGSKGESTIKGELRHDNTERRYLARDSTAFQR